MTEPYHYYIDRTVDRTTLTEILDGMLQTAVKYHYPLILTSEVALVGLTDETATLASTYQIKDTQKLLAWLMSLMTVLYDPQYEGQFAIPVLNDFDDLQTELSHILADPKLKTTNHDQLAQYGLKWQTTAILQLDASGSQVHKQLKTASERKS